MASEIHAGLVAKEIKATGEAIRQWPRDVRARSAELQASGRFTPDGIRAMVAEEQAGAGTRMRLASSVVALKKQTQEAQQRLMEKMVPDVRSSDPYVIALHAEYRAWARDTAKEKGGRDKVDAAARRDPVLAAALVAGGPVLSGLVSTNAIADRLISPEAKALRADLDRQAQTVETLERELVQASVEVASITGEAPALSGMTQQQKVDYVSEHGLEDFKALLAGDPTAPQPDKRSGRAWTIDERNAYVDEFGRDALDAWKAGDANAPWPKHLPKPDEDEEAA